MHIARIGAATVTFLKDGAPTVTFLAHLLATFVLRRVTPAQKL
jgi:hypothetical protein